MKLSLACTLLMAGTGLMRADIIESISLDLSHLHIGSTLSGTFTLSNAPMAGDTAPAVLSFSDPSDYSSPSVTTTISVISGTPSGFAVTFSPLAFTNPSGTLTPINTRDIDLTPFGFAKCASFPCTSSGGVEDGSPAAFTSTYTIAPVSVPEPGNGLLVAALLTAAALGRSRTPRRE